MRFIVPLLLFVFTANAQQRPNIIYIMSDDHDADAISAYNKKFIATPNIDRIANEGMRFNKAFVGNSICGPSRATLLTGQHSHKNGMIDNRTRFDSSKITMPKLMQAAGYQTAVVGKWHLSSCPTGFDFWKIVPGQGLYFEPRFINMQGDTVTQHGYASDVITDEALGWLDHRDTNKPFMLLLHHKAPHRYFFAPLKYIEMFHTKHFPEPPTLYNDTTGRGTAWRLQTMEILRDMKLSSDLKVDPKYLMDIPELKPTGDEINYYNSIIRRIPEPERSRIVQLYDERGRIIQRERPTGRALLAYKYQWYMQDYMATVASVDENVGRLLDYLDQHDLAKNTLVIYTSDQGFYLGENGWFDKRFMYDVSMQTPLLARWPGHIKPAAVTNALVQNIDFAPTILQAGNIPVHPSMQGLSLLPVLTGEQKLLPRKYLYYHFYEYKADHTVLPHIGVRGERYKLIYFYTVNEWELYDLDIDPMEQHNLIRDKKYAKIFSELKQELVRLRKEYEDDMPAGKLY